MFPFRSLRRTPWYVAFVVATLAPGLGCVLALCAVVDVALFRPLPFPSDDRLVVIQPVRRDSGEAVGRLPGPFYEALLGHRGLELVSSIDRGSVVAVFDDAADLWSTAEVSRHALSLLGVRPELGRLLNSDDFVSAAETPALISAALWARRFGRDPGVLGRVVRCERQTLRIVGVFPADTLLPAYPQPIWPDVLMPDRTPDADARSKGVTAPIARMRPGLTLRDVQAEMSTQLGPAGERYQQLFAMSALKMSALRDFMYGGQRRIYVLLSWAAVVILGVVCLNAANLLLARLRQKGQDVALQRALGASRRTLIVEMFSQNLVLAACALPASLAIATLICHYLRDRAPATLAVHLAPTIDLRIAVLGVALAIFVALVISALALPQMLRLADARSLRGTQIGGSRTHAWQGALIAVQIGLVLALVVGAGLMARSVARLVGLSVGADVEHVLLFRPRLPHARYSGASAKAFWDQLVQQVERDPRVASAAAAYRLPMTDTAPWASLVGRDGSEWEAMGGMVPVSRQYFETLGIRLTQGRTFTPQEDRGSAAVGVVNETAARTYWPHANPIGRTFHTPWFPSPHTVIGVVADSRYNPHIATMPTMYVPVWTYRSLALSLLVRSGESPEVLRALVASSVRQLEPDAVLMPEKTYVSEIARWHQRPLFLAALMGIFAALILGVAAVGTAAVVGYGVLLRYRELGIRLALGASRRTIHRLVLADTLGATTIGIVGGIVGASLFGRLLRHELYATTPLDPLTYVAATAVLLVAVLGAAYVPARFASRTDPSITLRHE